MIPPLSTALRLIRLAKFLLALTPEQWNYATWVENTSGGCGTTCCAAGWLPSVDPKNWCWLENPGDDRYLAWPRDFPELLSYPPSMIIDALKGYFEGVSTGDIRTVFVDLHGRLDDGDYSCVEDVKRHHVAWALGLLAQGEPIPIREPPTIKAAREAIERAEEGLMQAALRD